MIKQNFFLKNFLKKKIVVEEKKSDYKAAIFGLRAAGKTVLLTTCYQVLRNSQEGVKITLSDRNTASYFLSLSENLLKSPPTWPAASIAANEIVWSVAIESEKNHPPQIDYQLYDPPGGFLQLSTDDEHDEAVQKIRDFVANADAVLFLFEPDNFAFSILEEKVQASLPDLVEWVKSIQANNNDADNRLKSTVNNLIERFSENTQAHSTDITFLRSIWEELGLRLFQPEKEEDWRELWLNLYQGILSVKDFSLDDKKELLYLYFLDAEFKYVLLKHELNIQPILEGLEAQRETATYKKVGILYPFFSELQISIRNENFDNLIATITGYFKVESNTRLMAAIQQLTEIVTKTKAGGHHRYIGVVITKADEISAFNQPGQRPYTLIPQEFELLKHKSGQGRFDKFRDALIDYWKERFPGFSGVINDLFNGPLKGFLGDLMRYPGDFQIFFVSAVGKARRDKHGIPQPPRILDPQGIDAPWEWMTRKLLANRKVINSIGSLIRWGTVPVILLVLPVLLFSYNNRLSTAQSLESKPEKVEQAIQQYATLSWLPVSEQTNVIAQRAKLLKLQKDLAIYQNLTKALDFTVSDAKSSEIVFDTIEQGSNKLVQLSENTQTFLTSLQPDTTPDSLYTTLQAFLTQVEVEKVNLIYRYLEKGYSSTFDWVSNQAGALSNEDVRLEKKQLILNIAQRLVQTKTDIDNRRFNLPSEVAENYHNKLLKLNEELTSLYFEIDFLYLGAEYAQLSDWLANSPELAQQNRADKKSIILNRMTYIEQIRTGLDNDAQFNHLPVELKQAYQTKFLELASSFTTWYFTIDLRYFNQYYAELENQLRPDNMPLIPLGSEDETNILSTGTAVLSTMRSHKDEVQTAIQAGKDYKGTLKQHLDQLAIVSEQIDGLSHYQYWVVQLTLLNNTLSKDINSTALTKTTVSEVRTTIGSYYEKARELLTVLETQDTHYPAYQAELVALRKTLASNHALIASNYLSQQYQLLDIATFLATTNLSEFNFENSVNKLEELEKTATGYQEKVFAEAIEPFVLKFITSRHDVKLDVIKLNIKYYQSEYGQPDDWFNVEWRANGKSVLAKRKGLETLIAQLDSVKTRITDLQSFISQYDELNNSKLYAQRKNYDNLRLVIQIELEHLLLWNDYKTVTDHIADDATWGDSTDSKSLFVKLYSDINRILSDANGIKDDFRATFHNKNIENASRLASLDNMQQALSRAKGTMDAYKNKGIPMVFLYKASNLRLSLTVYAHHTSMTVEQNKSFDWHFDSDTYAKPTILDNSGYKLKITEFNQPTEFCGRAIYAVKEGSSLSDKVPISFIKTCYSYSEAIKAVLDPYNAGWLTP
ncbi:MAG: hypothetical protein DRR19_12890 [Candidatus Parabeggiatoa sp. nov. 1]|nr:MAG: hypothetical protein DRR19_12890 [Gammaproteobacteria bacterium]